jgi:hypothetical protein
MKTHIVYSFMFLTLVFSGVYAQSFEEYKKQQEAAMQKFADEQKEGLSRLQKEYADYVEKRDQEWADYLKKEWENYQAFTGKEMPQRPKPTTVPVFKPAPAKEQVATVSSPIVIKQTQVIKKSQPIPQMVEPLRKPAMDEKNLRSTTFQFYGRTITIPYDAALSQCVFPAVNQPSIGAFWESASATNYTPSIEKLLQAKTDLNINDFGYLLIVEKFARSIYPSGNNLPRLLAWFVMVRSGYGVRIAYQENDVALLLPSLQEIYQLSFLNMSGVNYYVYPKLNAGSFYTYDKDYQSAGRMVDFNINSPVNFAGRKANKTFVFEFEGKSYQIPLSYDPDLIDFYKDYPLVDLSVYFNAPVSVQAKESLAEALIPIVSTMNEEKAVNFILKFIHTAFPYKTDPEQFGREKFFFAEELFYYPYSDCEDRSVLFSYLVRETIGLKVVGLEYSDHVSAAVSFTTPVSGDYLMFENNEYVVSDPTYINAPVGLSMPQYKTVSPVVRKVSNRTVEDLSLDKQWEQLQAAGLYKGSIRKNGKQLTDGSFLLTGYFAQPTRLGNIDLSGTPNTHNCFVAKLNRSGQTVWAKILTSTGNSVGMSVETTSAGNVVVAGVFTGAIRLSGKSIASSPGKADLFVASYSPVGDLLWINKGGLEALPDSISMAFSVTFNNAGVRQSLKHADDQLDEQRQGLYIDNNGGVFYSGITNNALALAGNEKSVAFAAADAVDVVDLLRIETKKYLDKQTEKSMAALMAAIRLVRFMGVSLTGDKIKESINATNPNFKNNCPNIYKNLGKISFVKNSKGVITVATDGGGDISFDKVKISNNSTISISELQNGDYKVDVLSGIKVGKLVVWYGLNYIKMFAKKGDLLFDYATDNSQVTVNVQKDILN